MNWEAIGASGEILSAVAVLATLIYVAIQVRQLKQQQSVSSLQHIYDSINDFTARIAESESLASVLSRGRASYESLHEVEQLRFDHLHNLFMNAIESWHIQIMKTYEQVERDQNIANMREALASYCRYPGFADYWKKARDMYSREVRAMTERAMAAGDATEVRR